MSHQTNTVAGSVRYSGVSLSSIFLFVRVHTVRGSTCAGGVGSGVSARIGVRERYQAAVFVSPLHSEMRHAGEHGMEAIGQSER